MDPAPEKAGTEHEARAEATDPAAGQVPATTAAAAAEPGGTSSHNVDTDAEPGAEPPLAAAAGPVLAFSAAAPTPKPRPNRHPRALSPRQMLAIGSLLQGSTQADAAKAAGVGTRRVKTWMNDHRFRLELRRGSAEALDRVCTRARLVGEGAVIVLSRSLQSPDEATRLRAAAIAANLVIRLRASANEMALADLEAQVAALLAEKARREAADRMERRA